MENHMKPLFRSIAVLTLSAASLSAFASLKPSDLFGERVQAPSLDRTITITDQTKWVNVTHFEVIRFVSNGREFDWYFNGVAQPRPFDLNQIAPAGFIGHSVMVYVS